MANAADSRTTHTRCNHPAAVALRTAGFTQIDAARQLSISPKVLGQVLNGHKKSWPRIRHGLAELLDLDVDEIFPETSGA